MVKTKDRIKAIKASAMDTVAIYTANIVVTRIALAVVAGCIWGWEYGVGLLLACWLVTKVFAWSARASYETGGAE